MVLMHSSTNSPESGLGESRTSLPGSGGEEYYHDEVDAQPPLGTCRALYPFDGKSKSMDSHVIYFFMFSVLGTKNVIKVKKIA